MKKFDLTSREFGFHINRFIDYWTFSDGEREYSFAKDTHTGERLSLMVRAIGADPEAREPLALDDPIADDLETAIKRLRNE